MEISATSALQGPVSKSEAALRHLSEELEATFLAEMLKTSGIERKSGDFASGIGEDQFGSFLRQEHARSMVSAGGIGLAEQIFKALTTAQKGPSNG